MVDIHLNWLNWFHFLSFEEGLLIILIDCMIFLAQFLDVTRMSMSAVAFLAQLDSGTLLIECFPLTYDLNGFKVRINRHQLTVGYFQKRFPVCFNLFVLLFLVTPCFAVAIQPCME